MPMETPWTRILGAGTAAGAVIDAGEFVLSGVLFVDDWSRALTALGRPGELPAQGALLFAVWGMIAGIAAMWLYAALRRSMGAGTRTALRAGFFVWLCAWALANFGFSILGLFDWGFMAKVTLLGIVECVGGTLTGAWILDR